MIAFLKDGDFYEVWTNPEEWPEKAGRCLGSDKSEEEALRQAYHELAEDLKLVEKRIRELGVERPEP